MEGYMHRIVITSQMNIRCIDIDLLNTHMDCGAITLNPVNYPYYMAVLEYNMSMLVLFNILLSPLSANKSPYEWIGV